MAPRVIVGTSGWQYDSWRGVLYPPGLPQSRWLSWYAGRFPAVEVDGTFYRLPARETCERWREETPEGFRFAPKVSRFVTHIQRLRGCEASIARMQERFAGLGEKLGPVLFQLPPTLRREPGRLREVLALIPAGWRAAFEFRHRSWETDDVRAMLDRAGAALVLPDRPRMRVAPVVTGGWSFVRLHQGRSDRPDYAREKLRRWAARVAALPAREVWVFFNNDPTGAAVRDALAFTAMLARRGVDVAGPRPAAQAG